MTAGSDPPFDDDADLDEGDGEAVTCPTCKGKGKVDPTTAPPGFFCTSVVDCPACDGLGEV